MPPQRLEKTIFIADDNQIHRQLLHTMLASQGYTVTPFENGEEVLSALEDCTPDLLIIDIDMPFVNGIEVCQRMRCQPHLADLPVLMVTSITRERTVSRGHAEADGFLSKPVEKATVLETVRFLMAGGHLAELNDPDFCSRLAKALL